MPTLYGAWQGTGVGKARIRVEYTRTYDADHVNAIFEGTVYIEADSSISDSTNSWNVNSKEGNYNGTNLAISIGSGGGKKAIKNFAFMDDAGDSTLTASVSSIEYYGTTISGSFNMDNGALAPYLNSSGYTAGSITSSTATISGISGNANGSSLTRVQVEVNTSASDAGAVYVTATYATSVNLINLWRATTYYYRVRVENSAYGWGAWGTWKTLNTSPRQPGPPSESWYVGNIEQTAATALNLSVADDGGSALDGWYVRVNTSESDVGATDFFAGPGGSVSLYGLVPNVWYAAKVIAHNPYGYSTWSAWKWFQMLPGVSVNVGGVWKNAEPWVNIGGIWKPAVRYVNVGGVWKQ